MTIRRTQILAAGLLVALLLFLAGAFWSWAWNPDDWPPGLRAVVAVLFTVDGLATVLLVADE